MPGPGPSITATRTGVQGEGFEGRVLGGTYQVLRRLDEGGMGMVFEAQHLRLHRHVAVKVLAAELSASADILARFEEEAEMMSQIEHPHVVTVIDFDVSDRGEPYLVLELLHGETLAARLDREAPLGLDEAVAITVQTAAGLAAAHRASIVHRDLKPSNVFLLGGEEEPVFVKLLDFGIGKRLRSTRHITRAHQLLGTPEYMAPEQAAGRLDLVDPRTDQYALAVVAYEMLTGAQPFAHEDLAEVLKRVLALLPAPASQVSPWLPGEVDAVLARALSKEPRDRFPSVSDFATALAVAAGIEARPGSVPPRSRPLRHSEPTVTVSEPEAPSPILALVDRARAALEAADIVEASTHAGMAFDLATSTEDPHAAALLAESELVLTRVFMLRLGSPSHRLFPVRVRSVSDLPLSPKAAFLLSRLDRGMTVEQALDVAAMPRLQALRGLVQLVNCGAVHTERAG
jgi:serine/threonine-protein kinase